MRALYKIFVVLLMAMSAACATLLFDIQQPEITVSSFRALPSQGTVLNFEIMLHIKNPNPVTLKLNGISYSASIEGHRIITGTADALGSVEANGEGEYPILAQANLVSGAALLVDLLKDPKEEGRSRSTIELRISVSAAVRFMSGPADVAAGGGAPGRAATTGSVASAASTDAGATAPGIRAAAPATPAVRIRSLREIVAGRSGRPSSSRRSASIGFLRPRWSAPARLLSLVDRHHVTAPDYVSIDRLEQLRSRQTRREIELRIEREYDEVVVVNAPHRWRASRCHRPWRSRRWKLPTCRRYV